MWDTEESRRALVGAALGVERPRRLAGAARASDEGPHGSSELQRDAGDCALEALRNLALHPGNGCGIWADRSGARAALLQAAAHGGSEERRSLGLQGLRLLARAESAEEMWRDEATRSALIRAASLEGGADRELQREALEALLQLSAVEPNRAPMWRDAQARRAVVRAAQLVRPEDRASREAALGTLQNLAMEPANRAPMWQASSDVRAALVAAAQLKEPEDRRARLYAVLALQKLAAAAGNKRTMWRGG